VSNEAVKTPAGQAAIGKTIDKIFSLRKKKAELEAAVKDVEGQIALLDAEVLEALEASGVEKTATKHGTVSISTSTVAQVTDWDAFLAYIYRNKYGHLLQRRVSDPAWRELIEQGKKVPGTTGFTKKRLNYRAA
jgi:hypothetical protein